MAATSLFAIDQDLPQDELHVFKTATDIPPTYPSAWLQEHDGQKPPLEHYDMPVGNAYAAITSMLRDQQWDDVLVATFMKGVISENDGIFSVTSTDVWIASNRPICEAGDAITPLSLVDPTPVAIPDGYVGVGAPQAQARGGNRPDRLSRFYAILMIFRKTLARDIEEGYGTTLALKLNAHFQTNKMNTSEADINDFVAYLTNDKLTQNYVKLVSAIDMFFFRNSTAPYANMRMATLPSRYRGCVILTAADQISLSLGMSPADLFQHVLTHPVAKDVSKIAVGGQTAQDLTGYFPYQLGMGLTNKSPYSMSVCPTLHMWLHTIGCILGSRRSMNAIKPEDVIDLPGTVESAFAVALLRGHGTGYKVQFVASEAERIQLRANMANAAARRERAVDGEAGRMQGGRGIVVPPRPPVAALALGRGAGRAAGAPAVGGAPQPVVPERNMTTQITEMLEELIVNEGLTEEQLDEIRQRCRAIVQSPENTIGYFIKQTYGVAARH